MSTDVSNILGTFLWIARLEGVSLLVMFLVAMPLKYVFGYPEVVLVVGWVHGLLFITYVGALAFAARDQGWSLGWTATAFVASLLPAGTFLFEHRLRD